MTIRTENNIKADMAQSMTIGDAIRKLEVYEQTHTPWDRSSMLNLFAFLVEDDGNGHTNVPLLAPFKNDQYNFQEHPYILNEHALNQLLARLDWRRRDYQRLPAKMNVAILNYLIQKGEVERKLTLRVIDNNVVRAVLTDMYTPIDTLPLLRLAQPLLPTDAIVRQEFNDDLTYGLSLSFPSHATEIAVGDVVETGIHFRNSEVGLASVFMGGWVWRKRCGNGNCSLDSGDTFRFRHVGNSDRLKEMIQAGIESAVLEATKVAAQLKEAINTQIDNTYDFVTKFAKAEDMTQEKFKIVLDSMMEEDYRGTLFNVSAGMSRAANQFTGEDRYELQQLSTKVLSLPASQGR